MKTNVSRRKLLAGTMIAAISQLPTKAVAMDPNAEAGSKVPKVNTDDAGYVYEVNFTEEQWKARLTEKEFSILREGGTEVPKSSPLWNEESTGIYQCKGCDLDVYESQFKVVLDKGWVFFQHSIPNSVLTSIDYGLNPLIESHCRRCGSHLGHVFYLEEQILSCINGASLNFKPSV